jgi:FKBP-type peptidyl-prolyl cis-trans isomerase FkpA
MKQFTVVIACALMLCACQKSAADGPIKLETDEQKTLYALGVLMGKDISQFKLSPADIEFVRSGLSDGAAGKTPQVALETFGPKVRELAMARVGAAAQEEKAKGRTFLETAAKETGAVKTDTGLVFLSTTAGTGASPKPTDTVTVHYTGKLTDGTVFDSSVERGQPAEFPLNGVIPCWTEGVQKMKVGEKAKLTCPSDIAYGDRGSPPKIPGGATLVFDVELIGIKTK